MVYGRRCLVSILDNRRLGFDFIRWGVVVHYQPGASLARQKGPGPLHKHAYAEIGGGEKLDVYGRPREPREKSAYMNLAALHDRKAFANHRHVALIEITKRPRHCFSGQAFCNQPSRVASSLHRDLGDTRQWLAVLLNRC